MLDPFAMIDLEVFLDLRFGIGRLIDGFNTMLSEIQHRDTALQRANDELKTRTRELEGEIIHRKQTQEELLKAKHAAEDASRAKSAFLANMSHEIRTPLNAIMGFAEFLDEPDLPDSERREFAATIQRNGRLLTQLIDDILESGRTLAYAKDLIAARGARNVMTAVLLEKPGHLAAEIAADFRGFTCPDKFVVGYGMDMAHQFRELPFVGYVMTAGSN